MLLLGVGQAISAKSNIYVASALHFCTSFLHFGAIWSRLPPNGIYLVAYEEKT